MLFFYPSRVRLPLHNLPGRSSSSVGGPLHRPAISEERGDNRGLRVQWPDAMLSPFDGLPRYEMSSPGGSQERGENV